mmetsp:Transcript_21222/g.84555  ORF Transcript_21222/g.84555 Transcript_21222/m.84555 type:complete len:230 (+) Transcript_21222:368-1057(+)
MRWQMPWTMSMCMRCCTSKTVAMARATPLSSSSSFRASASWSLLSKAARSRAHARATYSTETTMSPRFIRSSSSRGTASGISPGTASSWNGNDRMSVGASTRRCCLLSFRMAVSVVSSTPTSNSPHRAPARIAAMHRRSRSSSMGTARCELRMTTSPTRGSSGLLLLSTMGSKNNGGGGASNRRMMPRRGGAARGGVLKATPPRRAVRSRQVAHMRRWAGRRIARGGSK